MRRPVELPGPALPRPAEEWAGREVGFAFSQASEESLREMSALLSFKGPAGLKVRVRLKHVVHTKPSCSGRSAEGQRSLVGPWRRSEPPLGRPTPPVPFSRCHLLGALH